MHGLKRIALLLCLVLPLAAQAAPQFPALSGRVVDEAGLLSAQAKQSLTQLLAGHEQAAGNQVVVVTVKSLQGYPIEDYGYQLGRHWGIGQKQTNNGVLLIVAPKERKVRIEVGYGLEGLLTDAISHQIIQTRILPAFKAGHYEQGIVAGTQAIVAALGGQYQEVKPPPRQARESSGLGWIFFVALGLGQLVSIFTRRRWLSGLSASAIAFLLAWLFAAVGTGVFLALVVFILHQVLGSRYSWYGGGYRSYGGHGRYHSSGWRGGGFGGGGFGGGGFGGGGGSFGGGGSSGSW
jgi:uncharacterized protein